MVRERLQGAGAVVDDTQTWPDASFRNKVRISSRKRSTAMEQAELWPSAASAEPSILPESVPVTAAPISAPAVTEDVSFVNVKKLRTPVPRQAHAEAKANARRVVVTAKSRVADHTSHAVRVNSIARFLNVNGAIEGIKTDGMRFDLPGRGHFQALRLWSGSSETAAYSSAQY